MGGEPYQDVQGGGQDFHTFGVGGAMCGMSTCYRVSHAIYRNFQEIPIFPTGLLKRSFDICVRAEDVSNFWLLDVRYTVCVLHSDIRYIEG